MAVHPVALFIVQMPPFDITQTSALVQLLTAVWGTETHFVWSSPWFVLRVAAHTGTPSCLKSVATWTFNCSCYSLQKGRSIGLAFCLSTHVRSLHVSKYWQQVQRVLTDVT